MKKILIILFFYGLTLAAQTKIFSGNANAIYQRATTLERENKLDEAEQLYKDLYYSFPNNSNYYYRLKNLYFRENNIPDMIGVVENWYKRHRRDYNTAVELGVLHLLNEDKGKAESIFRKQLMPSRTQNRVAVSIFQTMLRYGGAKHIPWAVEFVRKTTSQATILSNEYLNFLLLNQIFDKAVDEIDFYLKGNRVSLSVITAQLYRIQKESELFPLLIGRLEKNDTQNLGHIKLLAQIYFYTGDFEAAVTTLISPSLSGQFKIGFLIDFAQNLYDEKAWDSSLKLAQFLIDSTTDINDLASITFLIGRNYEALYRQKQQVSELVNMPYDNSLICFEFSPFPATDFSLLENALANYDSLIKKLPNHRRSADALFRTGMIRYNILNDFDLALRDFKGALRHIKQKRKVDILKRIIDIYIAKGESDKAYTLLSEAAQKYHLTVKEEDRLSVKDIQLNFLFGESDSLGKIINEMLAVLDSKSEIYNDILNFKLFSQDILSDSYLRSACISGERYIRQNNYSQALEEYKQVITSGSDIPAVPYLRYISLLRYMAKENEEAVFWAENRKLLDAEEYPDIFLLKYGEYLEFIEKNIKEAETVYTDFLIRYPMSPYFNTVRLHLRALLSN